MATSYVTSVANLAAMIEGSIGFITKGMETQVGRWWSSCLFLGLGHTEMVDQCPVQNTAAVWGAVYEEDLTLIGPL